MFRCKRFGNVHMHFGGELKSNHGNSRRHAKGIKAYFPFVRLQVATRALHLRRCKHYTGRCAHASSWKKAKSWKDREGNGKTGGKTGAPLTEPPLFPGGSNA